METVYLIVYRVTYFWMFTFTYHVEVKVNGVEQITVYDQVKLIEQYIRNGFWKKPGKNGEVITYKRHPLSTSVTITNYIPLRKETVLKNPE